MSDPEGERIPVPKGWWECPCCETQIATGTGKWKEYQARWDGLLRAKRCHDDVGS